MGIRISTLDELLYGDVDPFAAAPATVPVSYNGTTYEAPYVSAEGSGLPLDYVEQAGHTFVVGDAVRKTVGGYVLAQAIAVVTPSVVEASGATGIVVVIGTGANINKFIVAFNGKAKIGNVAGGRYASSLTVGQTYYLSAATAGLCTSSFPTSEMVLKPVFIGLSTDYAYIIDDRASVVPTLPYTDFTQASPSFLIGQAVYKTSTDWQLASNAALASAQVVGIITKRSGTQYRVTHSGPATFGNMAGEHYTAAFTPGEMRYLTTGGDSSSTEPASGTIRKELFIPLSATVGLIIPSAPVSVSSTGSKCVEYLTPGVYEWTAPTGVTSVFVGVKAAGGVNGPTAYAAAPSGVGRDDQFYNAWGGSGGNGGVGGIIFIGLYGAGPHLDITIGEAGSVTSALLHGTSVGLSCSPGGTGGSGVIANASGDGQPNGESYVGATGVSGAAIYSTEGRTAYKIWSFDDYGFGMGAQAYNVIDPNYAITTYYNYWGGGHGNFLPEPPLNDHNPVGTTYTDMPYDGGYAGSGACVSLFYTI